MLDHISWLFHSRNIIHATFRAISLPKLFSAIPETRVLVNLFWRLCFGFQNLRGFKPAQFACQLDLSYTYRLFISAFCPSHSLSLKANSRAFYFVWVGVVADNGAHFSSRSHRTQGSDRLNKQITREGCEVWWHIRWTYPNSEICMNMVACHEMVTPSNKRLNG